MSNDEHLKKAVSDMLTNAGDTNLIMPGMPEVDPAEALTNVMKQLEHGLMQLSHGQQQLGQGLDVAWFTMQMIMRVLVDKKVITEEELKDKHRQEVKEPIDQLRKQADEAASTAIAQQMEAQKNAGCNLSQCDDCKCPAAPEPDESAPPAVEEEAEESDSDVMLASERAGEVKKF